VGTTARRKPLPAQICEKLDAALEELDVHDHLCLIYENRQEQMDAIIPFIRKGLERNEQCVYIADENTSESVVDSLQEAGIDAAGAIATGALAVLTKQDAYLKKGYFDPDWMISFLTEATAKAKEAGFKALRATGEMTWVFGGDPGVERLVEYEAKLNYFFPKNDCLAICQYNRKRFPPEIIMDVIRTHPTVIVGSTVCRNYYYVPPDEFLSKADERTGLEVDRLLRSLTERERLEGELREKEARYRSTIDNSTAGYFLLDTHGRIRQVNRAWLDMYGYGDEKEVLGRHFSITLLEADQERAQEIIDLLLAGEPVHADEFMRKHQDGTVAWHTYSVNPVIRFGKVTGVEGFIIDITDLKHAERALRESEALFHSLFTQAPVAIEYYDSGGSLVDANPACLEMFGVEAVDEVKGFTLFDDPNLPEGARETLLNGSSVTYQTEFDFEKVRGLDLYRTNRSGEIFIDCLITPLFTDGQQPNGYLVHVRDITATRNAESAVRYREAELNESQRVARIGSWSWDSRTDTITWSDEYYRIYGIDPALPTPNYEEHLKVYTDESIKHLDEDVQKALQSGEPYRLDLEIAEPRGKTRWIAARGEAIRDDSGEIIGLRGTAQDITERKLAEDALRESEERYRTLFEASKDAIFISTPGGEVVDINPAGLELLGYDSLEELRQVNLGDDVYVHPEDRHEFQQIIGRQGFIKNYELELRRRDGEKITGSLSASSVRDEHGDVIAIRGIYRDLTSHRLLEQQLVQAQKMESIGQLAGGVAHDFNNILTAIQGYIDLAATECPTDSPILEELRNARASSEHAASLTKQLLMFGRREPVDLKPVDLNLVIGTLPKMLGRMIGEQYEIEIDLGPGLKTVDVDEIQIQQVLMNLAVNARDAMPGGGKIMIRTRNVTIDDDYVKKTGSEDTIREFVCLSVTDTGSGMDEKTRSRVFEPFFTTKGKGKGTGLGLAVAYGIIAQHDGWIDVQSTPGQGSTFRIYLPATNEIPEPLEKVQKELSQLQGRGEHVLLVEDEEAVRDLARKMIEDNGYVVETAADAESALELFEHDPDRFQLVFSDVILPGMDGVRLAELLLERRPDLSVLLASGYSEEAIREEIRNRNYKLVEKPYDLHTVLELLRKELDRDQD